jgi:hypothetical protein
MRSWNRNRENCGLQPYICWQKYKTNAKRWEICKKTQNLGLWWTLLMNEWACGFFSLTNCQKKHMRDSHELLHILKTLKLSPNVLLASMDIVSMYTNIPSREAIDVNLKSYDISVFQYKLKRSIRWTSEKSQCWLLKRTSWNLMERCIRNISD